MDFKYLKINFINVLLVSLKIVISRIKLSFVQNVLVFAIKDIYYFLQNLDLINVIAF